MGNNPAVRATVKSAGVTVIRTPLTSKDALQRVAVIEEIGARCLGILRPQDALQVVQMLGQRCNLYEWENEPDNGGPNVTAYSHTWNQHIPQLRAINSHAAFIGPVVAYGDISYIQRFLQLVKAAGNLPDAVSYHLYPCTDQSIETCPQHFEDYTQVAQQVKKAVTQTVGYSLPLAVTEWNYSWKPGQTPHNDAFMQNFTTSSLQALAKAGIALANQFDLASNAGYGSLDMINPLTGMPYPQLVAFQAMIEEYKPHT
ncbi:hypothetical protein KDI_05770 [Dictyobacter arantiisoli]|uniref:Asl1-like glycosyl hydrolase catalytic domain-containing protein n=2 Tax=Dictyobacter arantiisoli TaxID=2014874 RepID=A0A5A5T7M8_9CHLR|nr:hypothetical protein KDI_05770 [Dictyobacter arantiisoli]